MLRAAGRKTGENVDDLHDLLLKTRSQLSLALIILLSMGFDANDLADLIS